MSKIYRKSSKVRGSRTLKLTPPEKSARSIAIEYEKPNANPPEEDNMTFEDAAKTWFKEYAEWALRPKTLERMHQLEERTFAAIGNCKMKELSTRVVQRFLLSLNEDGVNKNTGGKLSPKTIRHYNTFVSDVCTHAMRMEIIERNPCSNVLLPKSCKDEIECYSVEEGVVFLKLLENVPSKYQAFFYLAIFGGFRRSEILGLEWDDFDYAYHTVTVRRTSHYTKAKGIYTDTTKTKKSVRTLYLPDCVFKVLGDHKEQQKIERNKAGSKWIETNRLFTQRNGTAMHPNTPYTWLDRYCEKKGMLFLGIHSLRHFNASILISSGVDPKTVSASLGHSLVSTTMNIYAHTFAAIQARAMKTAANVLVSQLNK